DAKAAFDESGRIMNLAIEAGQLTAAVRASELRMRVNGLLIDRSKQEIEISSRVDITAALAEARARVVAVQGPALPKLPAVRPPCDLEAIEDGEFTAESTDCATGPSDNTSLPDAR